MIIRIFVISALILQPSVWKSAGFAQPAYRWAFGVGDTGDESGFGIAVDGSGNCYVTGWFQGASDFDPGAGTAVLGGTNDLFVAKYDALGAYLWAFDVGGGNMEIGNGIAVDVPGNCYVTGTFVSTVDFDPGAGTASLSGAGFDDIFVARYDVTGIYQWAFRIGGTGYDLGNAITVDGSGNSYVTGYFRGTNIDFDPGAGTANLSSVGNEDIFVAKYSSSAVFQWAFRVGGTNSDIGRGISVDGSGNCYLTGSFRGTGIDFDPGGGTVNLTSVGFTDIFVAKYSSAGACQWAFRMGGGSTDAGYAITTDVSGNCYITGNFLGTGIDFDPGAGTAALTSAGAEDVFLAKYNASGIYQWAFPAGGTGTDIGYAVAWGGPGYVYATGRFMGTADFDPGLPVANLSSAGLEDVFVALYDVNGNYLCAGSMGDVNGDRGFGIAADGSGNSYLTGNFNGTADFDPGAGIAALTGAGVSDIFLAGYGLCAALPVNLISFSAELLNDFSVLLKWTVGSETGIDYFTVERSIDKTEFTAIGAVQAAGNSTSLHHYELTDYQPFNAILSTQYPRPPGDHPQGEIPNTCYYKLSQVNYDGTYTYSETVKANVKLKEELIITGISAHSGITEIRFGLHGSGEVFYEALDLTGSRVLSGSLGRLEAGLHNVDLPTGSLPSGIYGLILKSGRESVSGRMMIY